VRLPVIPTWLVCVLFAVLAAIALWRGGTRERIIAVAQAIEMLTGVYLFPAGRFLLPVLHPALFDGFILAVCLACLVRADRYWTVWACSFALLGEISDVSIFATGVSRWAWLSASLVWSFAVAAAVLWGVLTRPAQRGRPRR
jgi:hypothetical protein